MLGTRALKKELASYGLAIVDVASGARLELVLEPGDQVVYKARREQRTAYFPGHFLVKLRMPRGEVVINSTD